VSGNRAGHILAAVTSNNDEVFVTVPKNADKSDTPHVCSD